MTTKKATVNAKAAAKAKMGAIQFELSARSCESKARSRFGYGSE
jgi:hypothetical protein